MPSLAIGDCVGDYRLTAVVTGGYRAIHVSSARRVRLDVAAHDDWREAAVRMLRAARMIGALEHPGVARIVDRGVLADHRPWMATELPNGITLYDLIERRSMPTAEVIGLVRDLADVLAYAHERAVFHHALTLRNIVLSTASRGFPLCITDWGIRSEQLGIYGAPELEDGAGDGLADVYALGTIAYRAVTQRFPDRSVGVEPLTPPALDSLISPMLALDPCGRPTAAAVRAHAVAWLARGDVDGPVRAATPRFGRPKWTPAPLFAITSERGSAVGEIIAKPAKV